MRARNTFRSRPIYDLEVMKNAERLRAQTALDLVRLKDGAVLESETSPKVP